VRHRFAIDHFYLRFDQPLADPQVKLTIRQGRIPLINWSPESHGIITWGAIASGLVDRVINQQARSLRRLRKPVMLAFHHEPENDVGRYGTAAEYRAAFRHIVRRFRAEHARNVRFVCILEGYTYDGGNGGVRQWYPGRKFVDWAAADAYNWAPGRAGYSWRSFKSAFKGFYSWGKLRHKPLMAAEFGTQEKPGDPTAKARWITNARRTLRGWPRMKAVVYFNSNSQWPWWINTSRSSLRAYRGLVHDRRLQP
jgi:beta-mannanase